MESTDQQARIDDDPVQRLRSALGQLRCSSQELPDEEARARVDEELTGIENVLNSVLARRESLSPSQAE